MAGFILSQFIIIGMLVTAVQVMNIASSSKLTAVNVISLRLGFSIYAGWLIAATIINTSFVLKTLGFNDTEMNIDES